MEELTLFPQGDVMPTNDYVFRQCRREQHAACVRRFPGCGWNGVKVVPVPDHLCICDCHEEAQR